VGCTRAPRRIQESFALAAARFLQTLSVVTNAALAGKFGALSTPLIGGSIEE
jgi:hypothetical protein